MKEVVFVRKNIEKWREARELTNNLDSTAPDIIADTYLEVSADLAFAQTHYPDSEIVPLLNGIALTLHNRIYGYRQQRWGRIAQFWWKEIPHEVYRHRWLILISLGLLVLSALLGIVSTMADHGFARDILGSGYVEMTLKNIKRGEPMGVYGSSSSHTMMVDITLNNIGVSFGCYLAGMFTCFGTALVLVRNGVMLGTFMTFCQQQGVLGDCLMAMWLHGVFEITAIVIAGGAGLILGCGWLFPGSLPRGTSFRLGAKSSVKIIVGLIPLFVIAGFIESFITRHTHAPFALRLGLILLSLALVVFYFVYLPYKQRHGDINTEN